MPHRPSIARLAIVGGFLHRFVIIAVMLRLGEHEEVFMRAGRTVLNALRHDIWLVPNDVAAEKPPIVLQSQCESPWDSHEVFVFKSRRIVRTHIHRAVRILFVRSPPAAVSAGVSIADIEPENAVLFEHPLHFGKNIRQRLNKSRERWFQSDLSRDAVVTQSPIRRRGDDTLH